MIATPFLTREHPESGDIIALRGEHGVTIPHADLLSRGTYSRAGDDLLLSHPEMGSVRVPQYFSYGTRADLVTPHGEKMIPGALVERLTQNSGHNQEWAQSAQVQSDGSASPIIGEVSHLQGDVMVQRASAEPIALQVGDQVLTNDLIVTGADGSLGIEFSDGSVASLAENGRMVLDEFYYQPTENTGSQVISVLKGLFSFASGGVAATGEDNMRVDMPEGTIGVRGTTGVVRIGEGGEATFVSLLPDPDGHIGYLEVITSAGSVPLDEALETTQLTSAAVAPSAPTTITLNQASSLYGTVTSLLPVREKDRPDADPADTERETLAASQAQSPQDETAAATTQDEPTQAVQDGVSTQTLETIPSARTLSQAIAGNSADRLALERALEEVETDDRYILGQIQDIIDSNITAPVQVEEDIFLSLARSNVVTTDDGSSLISHTLSSGTQETVDVVANVNIINLTTGIVDRILGTSQADSILLNGRLEPTDIIDLGTDPNDFLVFARASSGVTVDIATGTVSGSAGVGNGTVRGVDNVLGSTLADTITGDASANRIHGISGNDNLSGGAGDDEIEGGAGDDRIVGGVGNDTLTGDAGADTFVFTAGDGQDDITDFASGTDKIRFEGVSNPNQGSYVGTNAFVNSGHAQVRQESISQGTYTYQYDLNGDGVSDGQFTTTAALDTDNSDQTTDIVFATATG